MPTSNTPDSPGRTVEDLERFFSLSVDMLCISGDDGYFKYVNAAWERTLGWTAEEMTAKPWSHFVHPDDLNATIEEVALQLERGFDAVAFENRYLAKDGSYVWLRWNSRPSAAHGEMHAIARDVTAQKAAEQALKTLNASLTHSNAELQAFTYSASHDLKEPLRSMEAFSKILLDEYADKLDADGKDYLRRIAAASVRMKQLIDDLLVISRIGSQHGRPDIVNVQQLIKGILDSARPTIRERNATVEVDPGLPDVFADPRRLEQIFSNLITNAIKFNRSGVPLVEVGSLVNDAGESVFFVRDNGIGIDPEYHEKIFGIFQRLHLRDEFEGTGAGLAIVQRAVEAVGGRIWVDSRPDAGATFLFTLPVLKPVSDDAAVQDAA